MMEMKGKGADCMAQLLLLWAVGRNTRVILDHNGRICSAHCMSVLACLALSGATPILRNVAHESP